MEKCQTLENQIKQNETKQKEKISSNELDYVRECLKVFCLMVFFETKFY